MFKVKRKNLGRQAGTKTRNRPPVFSYYSNQTPNPSTGQALNLKDKKKLQRQLPSNFRMARHIRNLPTYLAILVIVGSVLYALTLNTEPKILIGQVEQTNSLVRSQDTYQQAIHEILEKSLLNRSKLTISTESVALAIQKEFPEIDQAIVTIPLLGRRPVIGLDPSAPKLILSTQTGTFVIGQDGRALVSTKDLAKDSQQKLMLPTVEDQTGVSLEQGKAALPKDTVAFITTIINQLNAKHIPIESMTLPAIAYELHVKIRDKPYYVKFNLHGDAKSQVGTLLAVIDKFNTDNTVPTEYIDVRIEERAYYK